MKTNNTFKTAKSALALVLALATVIVSFCSCSLARKKVKIEDFVTVEFSSFNKHATASLTVDYDAFNISVDNDKMLKYIKKLNPEAASYYEYYQEPVSLSVFLDVQLAEEYENLANGDVVVVTAVPSEEMESVKQTVEDIEKGLGISIKDAEIEVEGLADAKEIDFFAKFDEYLKFDGVNGKGTMRVDIPEGTTFEVDGIYFSCNNYYRNSYTAVYENQDIGSVTFRQKADETGNYKTDFAKGDSCTVELEYSSLKTKLEELGYIAKADEYTVTVPDLGSYITSKEQLTDKDKETLKKALIDHMTEEGYGNPEIMATYYSKIKPGEVCDEDAKDIFVAIIAADKTVIFTRRYAYITEAYGIIKNDKGEIRFETTESWAGYDSEEAAVAAYNQDYTLEKLS